MIPFFLASCIFSAGTLEGFPPYTFPTYKRDLEQAIDSLYIKYPQNKVPEKWEYKDNWKESGYDFLDSRIFYFQNVPEEMYYVTFIGAYSNPGNVNPVTISIRAVINDSIRWLKYDEFKKEKQEQIQRRFYNEIISKLEKYTNTKSQIEDY